MKVKIVGSIIKFWRDGFIIMMEEWSPLKKRFTFALLFHGLNIS